MPEFEFDSRERITKGELLFFSWFDNLRFFVQTLSAIIFYLFIDGSVWETINICNLNFVFWNNDICMQMNIR